MTIKLYLLGTPRLETRPGTATGLERKTAAVLAHLALEGATSKYKLSGWLWPDSGEGTARNNMRQLLRRLRLSGADIVTGEERIELRPKVEMDVKRVSYLETPSLDLLRQDALLLEELAQLLGAVEGSVRRLVVLLNAPQELAQPRLARGRGPLDVDQLGTLARELVLVLEPRNLLARGDPAVALPVDAHEHVALFEVGSVEFAGRVQARAPSSNITGVSRKFLTAALAARRSAASSCKVALTKTRSR